MNAKSNAEGNLNIRGESRKPDGAWVLRYRPTKLSDVILPTRLRTHFASLARNGLNKPILLHGRPGVGKTSVAMTLVQVLSLDQHVMDMAVPRDQVDVQQIIDTFASTLSLFGQDKCVVFNEIDGLPARTQAAVLSQLDRYTGHCAFIFTCNDFARLIAPLRSRCHEFDFDLEPDEIPDLKQQIFDFAADILQRENVPHEVARVRELCERCFPDIRKTLMQLEGAASTGELAAGNSSNAWQGTAAELLTEIVNAIRRHAVVTEDDALLCAFWVLHAHCFAASNTSPVLALLSPIMGCGKSTLLKILSKLVPRPRMTSDITPAAIYHLIGQGTPPTLLIDEIDAGDKGFLDIVRYGHDRSGSSIDRANGSFSAWAPKVIAGIGTLKPTLADRSLIISLHRKKPGETIEALTPAAEEALTRVEGRAASWAQSVVDDLKHDVPVVPDLGNSRTQDNWRPLLAIADRIDPAVAAKSRQVAVRHSASHRSNVYEELALGDVGLAFDTLKQSFLPTADLLDFMHQLPDREWNEFRGSRALTPQELKNLLRPFKVGPRQGRLPGSKAQKRGYARSDFRDLFERYPRQRDVQCEPPKVVGELATTALGVPLIDGPPIASAEPRQSDSTVQRPAAEVTEDKMPERSS